MLFLRKMAGGRLTKRIRESRHKKVREQDVGRRGFQDKGNPVKKAWRGGRFAGLEKSEDRCEKMRSKAREAERRGGMPNPKHYENFGFPLSWVWIFVYPFAKGNKLSASLNPHFL